MFENMARYVVLGCSEHERSKTAGAATGMSGSGVMMRKGSRRGKEYEEM